MRLSKELFCLIFLALLFGCQNENELQGDPELEKAKRWFLQNETVLSDKTPNNSAGRDRAKQLKKTAELEKE